MSDDYLFIKFGEPQYCPHCGGNNPSGKELPKDCVWCNTGKSSLITNDKPSISFYEVMKKAQANYDAKLEQCIINMEKLQHQNEELIAALEYYAGCTTSCDDGGEEARSTLIRLGIKEKDYLK